MYVAMATALHMDYTLYLISKAFVNTGYAYVGYLCSLCNCIHINLQKHEAFLKYCSLRLCISVIFKHNGVDVRTSLTTLSDIMFKTHHIYELHAHIFVVCKDNLFKFSVIVHNS